MKRLFSQAVCIIALPLFFSASPVQAGLLDASGPDPVVLKADSKPEEAFRLLIDDGAALRHVSKPYTGSSKTVAIGTVRLNFVTDASDTARTKEFMGKATVSQSAQMKLLGVTPETMQAITNDFYAALRQKLKEQGYEVVEQNQLLENADFKAAVAETKPIDTSLTGSVTSVYATGTGAIGGFGMRNFAYYLKMPVVIADITLNFAAFDKETERWGAGDTIKASITSKAVSTIAGRMRLMTEDGGGAIYEFVRPLILPGQIAAKVEEIKPSAAETTAVVALKVFAALAGSQESSGTVNYQVTVVKNYREVMKKDMGLLAGVVANVLQKR